MRSQELPDDVTPVAVTTDLVVLTVRSGELSVVLIRRGVPPYRRRLALPGGFVRPGESLTACARRELAEETGLACSGVHLEQVATFGEPRRDPRGRVVSVAYLALVPDLPAPVAGTDARAARWCPVPVAEAERTPLAFDHDEILATAVERARAKLEYSPLATAFCPPEFTMSELRRVYQAVWGIALDPRNFNRKVSGTPGFVVATTHTTTRDGGRPARLYRAGSATTLHPPLVR